MSAPLHATLVAYRHGSGWRGVLLRGPSGAGKSALALRLMGQGWRLVADDRVIVWASGGKLWGRAPDGLRGLLEVRAVGVVSVATLGFARIVQVIDCVGDDEALERVPPPSVTVLCDVEAPLGRLHAHANAAPQTVVALCDAQRL